MLREGREAAFYLCNTNKESEVHIVKSQWLNVCCTGLDTFGERLSLDDVVVENEVTQQVQELDPIVLLMSLNYPIANVDIDR